jgi:competence protein ComEA
MRARAPSVDGVDVRAQAGERLIAVLGERRRGTPGSGGDGAAGADPPTLPLPVVGEPDAPVLRRFGAVAERVARRLAPRDGLAARVDPGRPGATALALVAAVAAVLAAAGVWWERPRAEPVDALPVVSIATPGATPGATPDAEPGVGGTPGGSIVVSVVGKVRTPGLVTLADGSRVADAVAAAGGALPGVDPAALNLARRLTDGEQIAVGTAPAADSADSTVPSGPGAASGPDGRHSGSVDINRATAAQLDTLPGVGPVTAERIVQWRTRNGPFRRVEQLREIEGIGERRFAQLRALVTVS